MERLNLPTYSFKLKSEEGRKLIFDEIRRKYVVLTPEEWVRQHFIHYLVDHKLYPATLIEVEKQFTHNHLTRRADILINNRSAVPVMLVECKAPDVKINQDTFTQAALYNLKFQLPYLVMTNGMKHYVCHFEKGGKYSFLDGIPEYETIIAQD
ncbi:MAG: type I restriction enzyme HsdR N-terminal domain-containing protein [Bacteroidales bacterium]|nr:type I restriction enzyme HsdR N-terminal domain-containing protein [Bacteroidales bacterium]